VGQLWFEVCNFLNYFRIYDQANTIQEALLFVLVEITRWVLTGGRKAQLLGPLAWKKRGRDELRTMVSASDKG
jgi:hypothetical protein